jgi:hypothetical protein
MKTSDELRAYMCGFAQAINHLAWDTEGTFMVVEPREAQDRGWKDGDEAYWKAYNAEMVRLAVRATRKDPP